MGGLCVSRPASCQKPPLSLSKSCGNVLEVPPWQECGQNKTKPLLFYWNSNLCRTSTEKGAGVVTGLVVYLKNCWSARYVHWSHAGMTCPDHCWRTITDLLCSTLEDQYRLALLNVEDPLSTCSLHVEESFSSHYRYGVSVADFLPTINTGCCHSIPWEGHKMQVARQCAITVHYWFTISQHCSFFTTT